MTAPSQAGPILTILSFVPFALIDDEESDCFEKDDDNDRKGDSFQHRHEIVLTLSVCFKILPIDFSFIAMVPTLKKRSRSFVNFLNV